MSNGRPKKVKTFYARLLWTIDQYSTVCARGSNVLKSETFGDRDNFMWRLEQRFWKGGDSSIYVSFFLRADSKVDFEPYSIVNGNATIYLMKSDYTSIEAFKFPFTFDFDGVNRYCELTNFKLGDIQKTTSGDTLRVRCVLFYRKEDIRVPFFSFSNPQAQGEGSVMNVAKIARSSLSRDLELIRSSAHLSDVTISVRGKNFLVHKLILAARSSVFHAMFRSDMQESMLNHIVIDDIDEEIFEEMLHYIYTGKTKNLQKSTFELLSAADKYDLKELKNLCEEMLLKKLSVDNAGQILILADMHNAEKLKTRTLRFIKEHCSSCEDFKNKTTEVWDVLVTSRPHLMKDMLMLFFET